MINIEWLLCCFDIPGFQAEVSVFQIRLSQLLFNFNSLAFFCMKVEIPKFFYVLFIWDISVLGRDYERKSFAER